jgi:hypothetical protein
LIVVDIEKLKALAEAARTDNAMYGDPNDWQPSFGLSPAEQAFAEAVSPAAVLKLIEQNEALAGLYKMHKETEAREMRDLRAEVSKLRSENKRLREGVRGDFDLDAWLDWSAEAEKLRAEVKRLRLLELLHGPKAAEHWAALAADRDRLAAALERVRDQLRAAGATLPAPEPQGTTESALLQGLCIALVLVEQELPVLQAPPLTSRLREKLQVMQEQRKPAGGAGGAGGAAHD